MLVLYRVCRNLYKPGDPSGAEKVAGRWHTLGQRVLYFSSSLALCVLELKANSVSFETIRHEFHYVEIEIDSEMIFIEKVPGWIYKKDWNMNRQLTQGFGDKWYKEGRTPILKVLSAALRKDNNYILNCNHPDFSKIKFPKAKVIPIDSRLR